MFVAFFLFINCLFCYRSEDIAVNKLWCFNIHIYLPCIQMQGKAFIYLIHGK